MDGSVEFLIENLKDLISYHSNLVGGARSELDKLKEDLEKLNSIFKENCRKYKKEDELFKAWEISLRDLSYEIGDTIDRYVTNVAVEKPKTCIKFIRLFKSTPITLAEEIKKIRKDKVLPLQNPTYQNFSIDDGKVHTTVADARKRRLQKSTNIVGLEDEAKDFIDFLNTPSSKLEVASIVGMAGLGKTTLAWKIFEDPRIKFEFPVRIWVNVSDSLDMTNVLLTILKHFTATEITSISSELLLNIVKGHLEKGNIFIVLDDIWTTHALKEIKQILPLVNHNCKVLVTTRNNDVAEAASGTRPPHYLRYLNEEQSWELLQYEVYGDPESVPPELVGFGKIIAKDCDGLPLSLVVIGGILVEKTVRAGHSIYAIEKEWSEVAESVHPYLIDGDKKRLLSSIISLSYEKISYELQNCFIYLGVYPKDANIHVNELIRLWIAEGFIQEKAGKTMEQVALEYLEDFINQNLVMVKEAKLNGEPKICHIHDAVRGICRKEAAYDNLNIFQEITRTEDNFEPRENLEKFRRLCIHSYVVDFLKQNKRFPNSRSILSFHPSPIILTPETMGLVNDGFNLLRVYNAKNIRFPKFPQKILQLLHLRYLTLVMKHCATLPESVSELLHLQTLIVDVLSNTLDIKADIWKMKQLRHLKTKATITLRSGGRVEKGNKLQTLSRLSPESCTHEVFGTENHLITLGIQGELEKHCLAFSESLQDLDFLQKLKFVNQVPNGVASESPLRHLPDSQKFPRNLKILVVSGTYMQWSDMKKLSKLRYLEVLKLKENAFKGNFWEAEYVFKHLQSMYIERSTELVCWKADKCHFPKLKFLLVNTCENLIEVPAGVCENLETLRMERVTENVVNSAKEMAKRKQKEGVAFKLEITPGAMIYKP